MTVPQEKLPALGDGFAQPVLRQLDLRAAGIANVIWATGYRFDFSMIKLPILDDDGYPIQTRGVTAYPGLFFVGLPWLHDAKSGLIYGVGGDASYIADRIAARQNSEAAAPAREQPKRAGARANPTLGFILQGFAAQAAGLRSAAAPARFPAIIESDAEPE
jgi:putative flavoprotein involved in K+ transport